MTVGGMGFILERLLMMMMMMRLRLQKMHCIKKQIIFHDARNGRFVVSLEKERN